MQAPTSYSNFVNKSSFFFFSLPFIDLCEFPFPSSSACPSVTSSPVLVRRDSILKHSGSVKNTDRRVSIKQNQPVVVEYLSEKRQTQVSPSPSIGRPASLILTKGERPTFKLIRSPSIDHQELDEILDPVNKYEKQNNLMLNNLNVNQNSNTVAKDNDDDDDESVPLVQNNSHEKNIITSSHSNI